MAGMVTTYSPLRGKDGSSEASSIVARVTHDHELYDCDAVLNGRLYFRLPAAGPVIVRWVDSFGRTVDEFHPPNLDAKVAPLNFSFDLGRGFTYRNWIRIWVNDVEQAEGGQFLLSPSPKPWDDFHAISWAHYPDGFYDVLRQAGVDATIAYREAGEPAIDNNFDFYVEQMAWEVFAIYHKNQPLWRGLLNQIELDRNNLDLWIRHPCVNDPKTDEYVKEHLTRFVRLHRDFRPLFYNIADELGQGDQIQPTDFCHSPFCTVKFAEYLRSIYGSAGEAGAEWGGLEIARWDDDTMRSGLPYEHCDLMIARTTTDRAFDSVAAAGLSARYGTLARMNKEWGTTFPEPYDTGPSTREDWATVTGMAAESRGIPVLDEHSLETKLGPLAAANARWGKRGGWRTSQAPTKFANWSEVAAFMKRFYAEVAEIR